MIKLLSCLLSFCIIFTSVAPSLASGAEGIKGGRRVRTTPARKSTSSTSRTQAAASRHDRSRATQTFSGTDILNSSRPTLSVRHSSLLSPTTRVAQAKQMLEHPAHHDLLIRSDFPILVLKGQVRTPEISEALKFYREQLSNAEFSKDLSIADIANTAADVASLGVMGTAAKDAALIVKVYEKSIGTPAEAVMTAAAARALLRLEAYKELEKVSQKSTLQPAMWEGIADYVKVNELPVEIAKRERTSVEVNQFQSAFKELGDLNTWAATDNADATFFYMNAGRDVAPVSSQASLSVAGNVVLPPGFELVEKETTPVPSANEARFASEGDGFAHTGPVQAARQAPIEQAAQATASTTTPTTTVPKYRQVQKVNSFGEEITTWELNPQYHATEPATPAGRKINFFDRFFVKAGTGLMAARMLLTSRYGLLGLGTGATPLTAEAAVHTAPTMEVVAGVRAAQRGFTNIEETRDASSGHARTEVNQGGVRAQQTAQAARTTTTASTTQSGSNVTRPVTLQRTSGMAAMAVGPVSAFALSLKDLINRKDTFSTDSNRHNWRDKGMASKGLSATFDVVIDEHTGEKVPVTFNFEDESTKEAFYKRVDLAADEYFVFDQASGAVIIRQQLTEAQKANGAKPRDRGFNRIFFKEAQEVPTTIFKTLFASRMASAFAAATQESGVMALLSDYKVSLKLITPKSLLAKYSELKAYFDVKVDADLMEVQAKENALLRSGTLMQIAQDMATEFSAIAQTNAGKESMPIEVFKDEVGYLTLLLNGFAEGTLGTMGQAITSALGALGIQKGALSNLPTSAGQFGPAWAPFIGAWTQKYGTRKMLAIGQMLGATGHSMAAIGLLLGALGVLPPLAAFSSMVSGITVNGIAGALLKQDNPMLAKQRASDPVSASATITDLNSWASVGGMFCYLFLPVVGALASAVFFGGNPAPALGILASMFGMAATVPLMANLFLRNSRIKNNPATDSDTPGIFATIGKNLKDGFKSHFIRNMFFATAGAHFMGLGFNSGPGHFIKENIANPSMAIFTSFLAIYLTVFLGRKLGAKAMKAGIIGDKALAGLSATIGVTMGAASLVPGLDFVTRCVLWAAAGMGFANWANVLQSIELNRPENANKRASVSTMYILARTSGMLTGVMGLFGDTLKSSLGLSPSSAALYALSMPLLAGIGSLLINRKYITKELWPTVKRWFTRQKKTGNQKRSNDENNGAAGENSPSLEEAEPAN